MTNAEPHCAVRAVACAGFVWIVRNFYVMFSGGQRILRKSLRWVRTTRLGRSLSLKTQSHLQVVADAIDLNRTAGPRDYANAHIGQARVFAGQIPRRHVECLISQYTFIDLSVVPPVRS